MADPSESVQGGTTSSEASPATSDSSSAPANGSLGRFAPGTVIAGKYKLDRVLGRGGIGIVVAARHLELEHTVAIKFLQPHAVENPTLVERFIREARLAAKIRSEHVVRVHDVGRLDDGTPYMVMEYLEGTDLARELEDGVPIPAARAVDYVLQACEALAEAHAMGIVHRDLKPENLFLARGKGGSSVIKLLDFGISKAMPMSSGSSDVSLTQDKDSFGTPSYMSPEQLKAAADVDPRADIWALGVVTHELLAVDLPFKASTLAEICAAVLHDAPITLAVARPDLPAGLSQVVERCLQRDRNLRYRSVAQLAQDLLPFADPASIRRIEHIVEIAREAGDSVRPPALSGEFPPISEMRSSGAVARSLRQEPTLSQTERDPTTHSPTSANVPGGPLAAGTRARTLAILAAAVLVSVPLLFLGRWLLGTPARDGAPSGAQANVAPLAPPPVSATALPSKPEAVPPPATGTTQAPEPTPAEPAVSAQTSVAPRKAPPAPASPRASTEPLARPQASSGVRAPPRPAASAASASPAPAKRPPPGTDTTDLGAIVNPFE